MTFKISFGTDGWRGRIAEDYTFANVRRCAQGFASFLAENGYHNETIVVGYDKRFHSENFARSSAEVLAGNGFQVLLTESATPTPVISFATVHNNAIGAVNITASHNPPTDNGFKVRNRFGGAIPPEDLVKIENFIPPSEADVNLIGYQDGIDDGRIQLFDPSHDYIDQVKKLVDFEPIRQAGLKILVDPMWGNGAGWFPRLLSGGKSSIIEIHNVRNPIFPDMSRPEPIQPNVDVGLKSTLEYGADVLIITDGDADRVGIGDEYGVFIDQLRVFGLLTYYMLEVRGYRGPIVKTLSTTRMLDKLGKVYDVPVYTTGVGFKYVAPKMLETNALIGGEESGGFAFQGHVPERDGIVAALFILDMMVKLNKTPSQLIELLFDKIGPHYYDRIDRVFKGDRISRERFILEHLPDTIGGLKVFDFDQTDGFKFSLEDGGWMLIRFSGTEPIIRVYTETTHEDRLAKILEDGLKVAGIE
jgi:phosphomannomutase